MTNTQKDLAFQGRYLSNHGVGLRLGAISGTGKFGYACCTIFTETTIPIRVTWLVGICVGFLGCSWRIYGSESQDPGGLISRANRVCHQHFHLRRAARPRSPVQPRERAQKLLRRLAALLPGLTFPVTGAFRLEPVLALMRLRPLAVRPPFLDLQPFLMPQPFIAPFFLLAITSSSSWRSWRPS